MAFHAFPLEPLLSTSTLSAVDVVRLSDALTHDGPVTEDEIAQLFALELAPIAKHTSWKGLFIDAVIDGVIHHRAPEGYLTADKADWLMRAAAPAGRVLSPNIFELLTALLAVARWVPERLVAALLDEVICAIKFADGPLRAGSGLAPGEIDGRDCDVIRRILYAAAGSDRRTVTRCEAEALLAIDASLAAMPAPLEWTELYCKAIADAVLSASGHAGPPRETLLSPALGVSDEASLVVALQRGFAQYRQVATEDHAIAALERQRLAIVTGDEARPCSAAWLAEALGRPDALTPAQAVLNAALSRTSGLLAQPLQTTAMRSVRAA
jgi:hypothetical protein